MQHERQDLDHLTVTAATLEQDRLQALEGIGQLSEGCPVADRPRLALQHAQVMSPVVKRAPRSVAAQDHASVFGDHLAFGGHDQAGGVDAQADRPVGVGGRDAAAVALEVDETGRRHPFGVFDEAIERAW